MMADCRICGKEKPADDHEWVFWDFNPDWLDHPGRSPRGWDCPDCLGTFVPLTDIRQLKWWWATHGGKGVS